jgi:hypothetical protein
METVEASSQPHASSSLRLSSCTAEAEDHAPPIAPSNFESAAA